jgi:hypothetical protein
MVAQSGDRLPTKFGTADPDTTYAANVRGSFAAEALLALRRAVTMSMIVSKNGSGRLRYRSWHKLVQGLFEKAARKEMSDGRTEGFDLHVRVVGAFQPNHLDGVAEEGEGAAQLVGQRRQELVPLTYLAASAIRSSNEPMLSDRPSASIREAAAPLQR